jgi:uncharacterized membrane protein
MTIDALGARAGEGARHMAMLGYALLFASIFFAGATALVAVVIAYSHRAIASRELRPHYDYQIRIFWVAFALSLAAALCGLAGLISGLGEIIEVAAVHGEDRLDTLRIDLTGASIDAHVIGLIVVALVLGFLSSLWVSTASVIGFIRLASEQGIGHSRAP